MELETVQFGKIKYNNEETINFTSGIFGFEHLQEYLIIDDQETQPFRVELGHMLHMSAYPSELS